MSKLISIVVPVYNTTFVLEKLVEKVKIVFDEIEEDYELIFVNDYSPNVETWSVLKKAAQLPNVRVVNLTRNFGQQAATFCGLEVSKGDYVITMDDDLQHSPSDIPILLEKTNKFDIIIGQFVNKKHTFFKRFTSKIKERFDCIILGKPKGIQLSAFRVLSRSVVNGMLQIKTPNPYISAMMFYVSKNIIAVNLEHFERAEGKSGYSISSLFKLFSFLLINNSSLLLNAIGRVGIIIFFLSLFFLIYLFFNYVFFGISITGWTSVVFSVFFFGGIQLFSIGIIGQYLIRIIKYSEQKPAYFISEILSNELK